MAPAPIPRPELRSPVRRAALGKREVHAPAVRARRDGGELGTRLHADLPSQDAPERVVLTAGGRPRAGPPAGGPGGPPAPPPPRPAPRRRAGAPPPPPRRAPPRP